VIRAMIEPTEQELARRG